MSPDILHSQPSDQIGVWIPVIAIIFLVLGLNIRVEVKIQKDDQDD